MKTTITVGSVTYAIKARKLLQRIGIDSKLVKVDNTKANKGCEYGIEFPSNFLYDVVAELKSHGIAYSVYTS